MRFSGKLAVLFALTGLARPSAAAVVWRGDLETGNTSQWSGTLNPRGIEVAMSPVFQGQYAAHITLTNADTWSNGLHRVELRRSPGAARTREGAETYFAWSIYLPAVFPNSSHQIGYWESETSFQQMMAFDARARNLQFVTRRPQNVTQWTGNGVLTEQTWHRIAMHIRSSKNATEGVVDVWFDGNQVVTNARAQTLNDDNPHFTQVGILRGTAAFTDAPEIFIDHALEGDSLADVEPGPPQRDGGGAGSGGADAGTEGGTGAAAGQAGSSAGGMSGSGGAAGAATGGAGGGSGAGGTPGTGGSAGRPASGGTNAGGKAGAAAAAEDDSGCGCATPGKSSPSRELLLLFGLGLVALRLRAAALRDARRS